MSVCLHICNMRAYAIAAGDCNCIIISLTDVLAHAACRLRWRRNRFAHLLLLLLHCSNWAYVRSCLRMNIHFVSYLKSENGPLKSRTQVMRFPQRMFALFHIACVLKFDLYLLQIWSIFPVNWTMCRCKCEFSDAFPHLPVRFLFTETHFYRALIWIRMRVLDKYHFVRALTAPVTAARTYTHIK